MQHDEKIPGVTFFLTKGEQLPPVNDKHLARGQVILDCEITDFEVWKEVLEKLNGLRIYTVSDLAEAMVTISQKKHKELQEEFHKYKVALNTQLQQLRQKVSMLEAENTAFKEANAAWEEWAKTASPGKIGP
jgi:glutamyl-tRNA reductase